VPFSGAFVCNMTGDAFTCFTGIKLVNLFGFEYIEFMVFLKPTHGAEKKGIWDRGQSLGYTCKISGSHRSPSWKHMQEMSSLRKTICNTAKAEMIDS